MNITLLKLNTPEHSGDWHDKPLRWLVGGPNTEIQKFSSKKSALKYKSIRSKSPNQIEAIKRFSLVLL